MRLNNINIDKSILVLIFLEISNRTLRIKRIFKLNWNKEKKQQILNKNYQKSNMIDTRILIWKWWIIRSKPVANASWMLTLRSCYETKGRWGILSIFLINDKYFLILNMKNKHITHFLSVEPRKISTCLNTKS